MERILKCLAVGLMLSTSPMAWAQTDTNAEVGASEVDPALLLTQAELENLVAPVALYPDTLLIQILVAATFPFEIIKADRFLASNAGSEPEALNAAIEAEGYDMSVEVLATAFPDVLADMAANAEWTESIGTAMLAQSDDVLAGVQTMRDQAINSGALISGPEQTVETVEDEVIITPTDPQVVYVPQYDTQTVYVQDNSNDALANALIFVGTVALINNIFDNNNYWHGYWGCRNCGGWGGGPIIRNPNVNIINGNVNIGNRVDTGWKPEPRRQQQAQNKIAKKRGPGGATTMPVRKQPSRGDDMRSSLTRKTGAADISRPGADRGNVNRPATRPAAGEKDAIARTDRKPASAKAPVRQPTAKPAAKRQPAARAPAKRQPSAMNQRAAPQKSRASSSRGKSSGGARAKSRR
jgi:uncharacterized protein DUF3300